MANLIDLIGNELNLKMIERALEIVEQLYSNLGVTNGDSIKNKQILEDIRNSRQIFGDSGIITANKFTAGEPELYHKACVKVITNNEQAKFPTVTPGFGLLMHYGHAYDGTLYHLECKTCKKKFKIMPFEDVVVAKNDQIVNVNN